MQRNNLTNLQGAEFALSPLFNKVIATIALLYAVGFVIYVVYTQSIATEFSPTGLLISFAYQQSIFSGLAICSVAPIKPADDKLSHKPSRLSNEQKAQFKLSKEQKEIAVGCILGDLSAQKQSVNVRLCFSQGIVHKEYLDHLYGKFRVFCPSEPKVSNFLPHKETGMIYSRVRFNTFSLPCFVPLHDDFYVAGKKVVPSNIGALLTALALAYWICDDGRWDKKARHVRISTHSFTLAEVNLLADALNKNFDLKCYVNKHTSGGYIIIIPSYSVPKLQTLLAPHMPDMMSHKIGL